jgi:hypothetical protein
VSETLAPGPFRQDPAVARRCQRDTLAAELLSKRLPYAFRRDLFTTSSAVATVPMLLRFHTADRKWFVHGAATEAIHEIAHTTA